MEMFPHITAPTIIRIPPKLYHCPLNFKNIKKPSSSRPFTVTATGPRSRPSPTPKARRNSGTTAPASAAASRTVQRNAFTAVNAFPKR
jgi:hypothetical protein